MAFDKDTGASAGKKSKRGSSKQINEIREVYCELLHNNKDKLQEWFDEVGKQDPAKALDLMLKMSAFVLPKYKLVESKER
ncbi:hypothetical protein OAN33_07645 [Flavobacteriales bacterium]|nr:hypothetical protein [Flavobacteriales bacterium]